MSAIVASILQVCTNFERIPRARGKTATVATFPRATRLIAFLTSGHSNLISRVHARGLRAQVCTGRGRPGPECRTTVIHNDGRVVVLCTRGAGMATGSINTPARHRLPISSSTCRFVVTRAGIPPACPVIRP